MAGLVPQRALAIRVTKNDELCKRETVRALHGIVRYCAHAGLPLHVWVSTPCTVGSPWQRINRALGASTGDVELSDRLISISIGICRHVVRQGGNIYWDWPPTSALWDRTDVQELLRYVGADYCDVSTASLGMSFRVKEGDAYHQRFLKQCWRMATNS